MKSIQSFKVYVLLLLSVTMAKADTVTVKIDPSSVICSNFMGMGVQWDPFDWYQPTAKEWKTITNRMNYCQPGYLRVMWSTSAYCFGFDSNGQPRYVWNDGNAEQRKTFEQLTAILDFAQARHIPVIYGEWSPPAQLISDQTDPRWARIIADGVAYLRDERGYKCISYYNLINEPNGDWSHNKDYASWLESIRNLKKEFDVRGFGDAVRIIGPDTTGNTHWLEPFHWLEKSAKDVPDCIGAWDLHWYATDSEVLDGAIESLLTEKRKELQQVDPQSVNQPLFLAESGLLDGKDEKHDQQIRVRNFEYGVMMADYAAQVANAGWMGALAWDMDDAMHVPDWHHTPKVPDSATLKVWGFWNSMGNEMGHPEETVARPWFYTWSLMSRLFPRGTCIIQTETSGSPQFRAAAGVSNSSGQSRLSIMLVNDSETNQLVQLRVPSEQSNVIITCYHYFKNSCPLDRKGFPKPHETIKKANLKQGLELDMPAHGVIFLAVLGGGQSSIKQPVEKQ